MRLPNHSNFIGIKHLHEIENSEGDAASQQACVFHVQKGMGGEGLTPTSKRLL